MSNRNLLFILGCPRSGTTWLQLLLSQNPGIASAQETHLFPGYLGQLLRVWNDQTGGWRPGREVGLANLIDEERFYGAMREFADRVFHDLWGPADPDIIYMEKTPQNYRQFDLITRLYPDARFIHMVRDPRAVAASLIAASRGWGKHWAPGNAVAAAELWRGAVQAGLELEALTDRCLRIRYEDLLSDGPGVLGEMLDWLVVPRFEDDARSAVEACSVDRMRGASEASREVASRPAVEARDGGGDPGRTAPDQVEAEASSEGGIAAPWSLPSEPTGFIRSGGNKAWKEDLSAAQVAAIEHLCEREMLEFGYETTSRRPGSMPLRLRLRLGLERVREALDRRARAVISRL